jgi:hypothetical protein
MILAGGGTAVNKKPHFSDLRDERLKRFFSLPETVLHFGILFLMSADARMGPFFGMTVLVRPCGDMTLGSFPA